MSKNEGLDKSSNSSKRKVDESTPKGNKEESKSRKKEKSGKRVHQEASQKVEQINVECTRCFRWMEYGTLEGDVEAFKCPVCGRVIIVRMI